MSYLLRVLLVLLILALPAGCGREEPTAEEPAAATDAAGNDLDYVAFGDSLATGYDTPNGYVYRYAGLLGADTGATVSVNNLGVNGLTSEELRAGIENDERVKETAGQAEVITINIGANDLLRARMRYRTGDCGGADNQDCLRQAASDFRANWDAILHGVTGMRSPDTTIIRTIDFYNPFVGLDSATNSWSEANDFMVFKTYLEQVNSHIARSSDAHGIRYAGIYEAFNGPNGDEDASRKGYLSSDGIHPSDEGHALIARELGKLGYEPLYEE